MLPTITSGGMSALPHCHLECHIQPWDRSRTCVWTQTAGPVYDHSFVQLENGTSESIPCLGGQMNAGRCSRVAVDP